MDAAFWGVRYQVKDIARAVAFYTDHLGFKLDQQHLPAFAQLSVGNLKMVLSGPGASGSRPMPDGRSQEPGGWNRIMLAVADLPARIEALKGAGVSFRNEMEAGPGGKQVQLEDPVAIRSNSSSPPAARRLCPGDRRCANPPEWSAKTVAGRDTRSPWRSM
jgi:glyoxylase I family protein